VQAHNPENMWISYDYYEEELVVNIEHNVTDPETHYINLIQVYRNNALETSRTYTHQNDTYGMMDYFYFIANRGDEIRVTATCTMDGQISRTLTVDLASTDPYFSSTPNSGSGLSQFQIAMAIIAVLICIAVACGMYILEKLR